MSSDGGNQGRQWDSKDLDFEILDTNTVSDYRDHCLSGDNSEGTVRRKISSLRKFDSWCHEADWTPRQLYNFTDDDLGFGEQHPAQEYEDWLAGTKDYADNTVMHHYYHARDYLRYLNVDCFDAHELDRSRTSTKEQAIDKQETYPWLTVDEYKRVRSNADSFRTELMIEVGFETGVRRGELANIRVDKVFLDDRQLIVPNLKRPDGEKSRTRTVYVPEPTKLKLDRWLRVDRKQYNYAAESPYLFPSNHGVKYSTQHINKLFKDAVPEDVQVSLGEDAKGHERVLYAYHCLRHSFCYHRVQQGMPLNYLSELTGDKIETLRTYLEIREEDKREANDKYRPNL